MPTRYKVSKLQYIYYSLIVLILCVPLCIVPLFYLDVIEVNFWFDYSLIYLIIAILFLIFYRFSKYFFGGYVFEIKEDGIYFLDGTRQIEFALVSKIEKKASSYNVGRHISFELKPEYRKIRLQHFPIFFSYGGKCAFISFYYLSGGKSEFYQLYEYVCKEHQKYNL